MSKITKRDLMMIDKRNEMRFELLYTYFRVSDGKTTEQGYIDAQEMSAMVREFLPIDWE